MSQVKGNGVYTIGTAKAEPGQLSRGVIPIGERTDGSSFDVPVILIRGKEQGPTLWVQACIHGDEYDGAAGLLRAISQIKPDQLKGTLIAITDLTVSGTQAYRRTNPIDDKDINRFFPGNPAGSFVEQTAYTVQKLVEEHADYLMDLHGGGNEFDVVYYTIFPEAGNEASRKSEAMARAAGSAIVWQSQDKWLVGGLFSNIVRKGIPCMLVECGGEGRLKEQNINDHCNSILNVMKHLHMIEGNPPTISQFVNVKQADFTYSTRGGLYFTKVVRGQRVRKGDLLGEIVNFYGDTVETVRCKLENAIVLGTRTYGVTPSGENVVLLGDVAG